MRCSRRARRREGGGRREASRIGEGDRGKDEQHPSGETSRARTTGWWVMPGWEAGWLGACVSRAKQKSDHEKRGSQRGQKRKGREKRALKEESIFRIVWFYLCCIHSAITGVRSSELNRAIAASKPTRPQRQDHSLSAVFIPVTPLCLVVGVLRCVCVPLRLALVSDAHRPLDASFQRRPRLSPAQYQPAHSADQRRPDWVRTSDRTTREREGDRERGAGWLAGASSTRRHPRPPSHPSIMARAAAAGCWRPLGRTSPDGCTRSLSLLQVSPLPALVSSPLRSPSLASSGRLVELTGCQRAPSLLLLLLLVAARVRVRTRTRHHARSSTRSQPPERATAFGRGDSAPLNGGWTSCTEYGLNGAR